MPLWMHQWWRPLAKSVHVLSRLWVFRSPCPSPHTRSQTGACDGSLAAWLCCQRVKRLASPTASPKAPPNASHHAQLQAVLLRRAGVRAQPRRPCPRAAWASAPASSSTSRVWTSRTTGASRETAQSGLAGTVPDGGSCGAWRDHLLTRAPTAPGPETATTSALTTVFTTLVTKRTRRPAFSSCPRVSHARHFWRDFPTPTARRADCLHTCRGR